MALLDKTRPASLRNCPAPAKLNLFLHVTGRRPDGYHLLETVFQLTDFCDYLHFTCRDDGQIRRITRNGQINEEDDLIIRAANLLRENALGQKGKHVPGIDIEIEKNLPVGGGLGGGSSDAATTLMALNYLWNCRFDTQELIEMGIRLGADVPFFLLGENAFAEGIGEKLTPIKTPGGWFVVIKPPVSVPTALIFRSNELTRNTEPIKMTDFPGFYERLDHFGRNDLQGVATRLFPEIGSAINELEQFGNARMTGSGACVFSRFSSKTQAEEVAARLSVKWETRVVQGLQNHPLKYLLDNKGE